VNSTANITSFPSVIGLLYAICAGLCLFITLGMLIWGNSLSTYFTPFKWYAKFTVVFLVRVFPFLLMLIHWICLIIILVQFMKILGGTDC